MPHPNGSPAPDLAAMAALIPTAVPGSTLTQQMLGAVVPFLVAMPPEERKAAGLAIRAALDAAGV